MELRLRAATHEERKTPDNRARIAKVLRPRPGPKFLGVLLVVRERRSGNLVQLVPFARPDMHRGLSAFEPSHYPR